MKKYIFGVVFSLGILVSPALALAQTTTTTTTTVCLTTNQIDSIYTLAAAFPDKIFSTGLNYTQVSAILNLLDSFLRDQNGVISPENQSVINTVKAALMGVDACPPPNQPFYFGSPTSSDTWTTGTTQRIAWKSDSSTVSIGYSSCDGCLDWIATNIPNTGYYDWNVNVGNTTNTRFKIKIIGYTQNGTVSGESDYFNVVSGGTTQPTITVISPNGGENLVSGQTFKLKWNIPSDKIYTVSFYLVPQNGTPIRTGNGSYFDPVSGGYGIGGQTLSNVASNVESDFTIPSDIPSGTYKMRAYLVNDNRNASYIPSPSPSTALAYDDSNAPFTVTTVATGVPAIMVEPSSISKSVSTSETLSIGFIATNRNFIDSQGRQFAWELIGNVPSGVYLSTEGAFYAVLRGTPTQIGNYSFTVRAKHPAVPSVYGDVPVILAVTTTPTTVLLTQSTDITTSPEPNGAGQPFTLTWSSQNATSCTLKKSTANAAIPPTPSNPVTCYDNHTNSYTGDPLNGSCQPTPAVGGTHIYEFICTGPNGIRSERVTHNVVALSQAVDTTTPGQPFTLTWGAPIRSSCALKKSAANAAIPPTPNNAVLCYDQYTNSYTGDPVNGSCQPNPSGAGTHIYVFSCSVPGGAAALKTITHTVNCPTGFIPIGTSCVAATASALNGFNSATSAGGAQTTTSTTGFSYTFTLDLYRGQSGAEVSALQQALKAEGLFTADITGNFYDQTREAVMAFQTKYGISPTGYVGSATRAQLNALY